ncbi:MAG TPA: hypothetical protein PLS50_05575 [Candidatus Dojkabacteria bacterium]|nr:hypothetical protein [Candidatus Dojkabacteria bacterium]
MKEAKLNKLFEKVVVSEDQQSTLQKLIQALHDIYPEADLKLA